MLKLNQVRLFSFFLASILIVTSCTPGGGSSENDEEGPFYYEADHKYIVQGEALQKRMRKFYYNLPTEEEIAAMMCDSVPESAFKINGNTMDLYLFDPDWLANFDTTRDGEFVHFEGLAKSDSNYWQISKSLVLDQMSGLTHFTDWEHVTYKGKDPRDPSHDLCGHHGMLAEVSLAYEKLEEEGNYAVVYRMLRSEAKVEDAENFEGGFLGATVVVFSREMEPVCAYPVLAISDENIKYSYYEGDDPQQAAEAAAWGNLHGKFTVELGTQLANRVQGRAGKYVEGYGTFSVRVW